MEPRCRALPAAQARTQQSALGSGKQAWGVSGGFWGVDAAGCAARVGRSDGEGKGDNTQQIS